MEQILANNLTALMAANKEKLGTQAKVAKATGNLIDQKTVSRIKNAKVKVQIDTLAALAVAFDLEPYQLLIRDLNPKNPQVLRSLSAAEENLYRALEEARRPG